MLTESHHVYNTHDGLNDYQVECSFSPLWSRGKAKANKQANNTREQTTIHRSKSHSVRLFSSSILLEMIRS